MAENSRYSYRRMLEYIESRSSQLEMDSHIAYILSMREAKSIEDMINIYNHAYQFLAILFYGTKKVPQNWYRPKLWGYCNEYLVEDLNNLFNESLLSWFKRKENANNEQALKCISNLRYADNFIDVQEEILSSSNPEADNGIQYLISVRNRHDFLRTKLEDYCSNATIIKGEYISCCRYLAAHNRIFDVSEIAFGKDNDISYENLIEEYKQHIELEKKQKEEIEKKRKKELRGKMINTIIIVVLSLIIMIPIVFIMSEVGLIGIIIIIGFIGAIPKIFLTGKL